jgi:hypothetical protein
MNNIVHASLGHLFNVTTPVRRTTDSATTARPNAAIVRAC